MRKINSESIYVAWATQNAQVKSFPYRDQNNTNASLGAPPGLFQIQWIWEYSSGMLTWTYLSARVAKIERVKDLISASLKNNIWIRKITFPRGKDLHRAGLELGNLRLGVERVVGQ